MQAAKIIFPGRYSSFSALERWLKRPGYEGCRYFILVDEHTYDHCLPPLVAQVEALQAADFLEVPLGEEAKSIEVATQLWGALQDSGADRKTVIVNLGGGCVSDLGGFVAASYQRGIHYINVPTTLLGMVDAAVGGKTALNLNGVKNQVGFVHQPDAIVIEPAYLQTLLAEEWRSGLFEFAEDVAAERWRGLSADDQRHDGLPSAFAATEEEGQAQFGAMLQDHWIIQCAEFKAAVARQDPNDLGARHILNLGHTFGHAIESYSHQQGAGLSHGVSAGIGIACAMYLSVNKMGFPREQFLSYTQALRSLVAVPHYTLRDTEALLAYMRHDKKNANQLFYVSSFRIWLSLSLCGGGRE